MSSKQYLQIQPINAQGTFSHDNSMPIIKFSIPAQERLILTGEVRMYGKIVVKKGGAIVPSTFTDAGVDRMDGTLINSSIGLNAAIHELTISSKKLNQQLESIHEYSRLCSSVIPNTTSDSKYKCGLSVEQSASGIKIGEGGYQHTHRVLCNTLDFSLPIFAGLFQSGLNLPLSQQNGLGGIDITIQLSTGNQAIWSENNPSAASDLTFEVQNPFLCVPVIDDVQQQPSNTLRINTWNYLNQNLSSTNNNTATTLGNSNIIAVVNNYALITSLNNSTNDHNEAKNPKIRELLFNRNGLRFPLDYTLKLDQNNSNADNSQKIWWEQNNVFRPTPNTLNTSLDKDTYDNVEPNRGAFSSGVSYDRLDNNGVNFNNMTYQTNLKANGIDSGANKFAVFNYFLTQRDIAYTPSQVMVQT